MRQRQGKEICLRVDYRRIGLHERAEQGCEDLRHGKEDDQRQRQKTESKEG
ncbi:hypothetical protein D3C87_1629790 [compost metagenome]